VNAMNLLKFVGKMGKLVPYAEKIGRYFISQNLKDAVNYLFGNSFSAEHLAGGSLIIGGIVLLLCFIIFNHLLNMLSTSILSFSLAIFIVLLILNSVIMQYNGRIAQIERMTPYVLEELATIYLSTRSIFEAILYVSQGEYGIISSEISDMIDCLNAGISPESLLSDFSEIHPSNTLRRGLTQLLYYISSQNDGLDTVIKDAHENLQRQYESLTFQWESRMMVYAGVLVFLPLILVLGLSIRGLAGNPVILLLPILHYSLSSLLQKILLPRNMILIGE